MGSILDDWIHVNNSSNCLSVTAKLGNQPPDINIIGNLVHRQKPRCPACKSIL